MRTLMVAMLVACSGGDPMPEAEPAKLVASAQVVAPQRPVLPPPSVVPSSVVYGRVYDAVPLTGVLIEASDERGVVANTVSDDDGAYELELPAGTYRISYRHEELVIDTPGVVVGSEARVEIWQQLAASPEPTQGITIDREYLQIIPLPGRTFESALGISCGGGGQENTFVVDGISTEGITFGNGTVLDEVQVIGEGYAGAVPCADAEPVSFSSQCGTENVYIVDGAPDAE